MPTIKKDNTSLAVIPDQSIQKSFPTYLDIDPDDYPEVSLTPTETLKIKRRMGNLTTGAAAAIPLWCKGAGGCPFSSSCPYIQLDQERMKEYQQKKSAIPSSPFEGIDLLDIEIPKQTTPVGKRCLLEINLLNEWTRLYIQEYQVNPNNFTEFQMVRELAEVELLLWRLNNNIAKPENAELVQETVVGIDKQGNVLTRQEVSSIFEAKERLSNRKSKLVKLMVGDRQEKYKKEAATKSVADSDPSITAAKLRGKIEKLLSQAKELDNKVRLSEDRVIDVTPVGDREEESPILSPEDLISGVEE